MFKPRQQHFKCTGNALYCMNSMKIIKPNKFINSLLPTLYFNNKFYVFLILYILYVPISVGMEVRWFSPAPKYCKLLKHLKCTKILVCKFIKLLKTLKMHKYKYICISNYLNTWNVEIYTHINLDIFK
jgi:hypothetical protein